MGRTKKSLSSFTEYWKFDDDFNGEIDADLPLINGNVILDTGKINDAAKTTDSGRLIYSDNDRFTFADESGDLPFSVSLWFRATSFSSSGNWFFSKRPSSGTGAEYQFHLTAGQRVVFALFSEGSLSTFLRCEANSFAILADTWYHVVYTYDGSGSENGMKIYINGNEQATLKTQTGTYSKMINTSQSFAFFRLQASISTSHIGSIDELGVWKGVELNQNQIDIIYNSGTGKQPPF
jgi:hypothetical protein